MDRNTPQRRYGPRYPQRRIPKPQVRLSAEAADVLRLLAQTRESVFLTGRAGTGKSTLLQYFRATTTKRLVVLAPTGVAAVNVQGQTLHSFFGFGPDITVEKVRQRHVREAGLFQRLETIVIDEMSMVRADLLDCIDTFLRLHGPESSQPFGGIQMLLIGDLYQLPPVVTPADEEVFCTYYASPYFFDARVLQEMPLRVMELTQVYRQHDPAFVAVLDAIRTCSLGADGLALLNTRVRPTTSEHPQASLMHLVPTNAQADQINAAHLARLPEQAVTFQGAFTGDFRRTALPTSEILTLKPGARMMLLANDPEGRWVNGDVGIITALDPTQPARAMRVQLDNGYSGSLGPHTWEMIRFTYDPDRDRIEAAVVGSFTQYPVRLAWALTIHKAQGKTFAQVLVDFGRGTFAHGQAYVALSRCTSLEGLRLQRPVEERHIFIDRRVLRFLQHQTGGMIVTVRPQEAG
jgi:ATP-dependent DNA helicase PIF1